MEALPNAFLLNGRAKRRGKELLELLEKVSQRDEFTPLEANYFLYLKAMYYRTPEAISKAVSTIRSFMSCQNIRQKLCGCLFILIESMCITSVSNMIRSVSYLKRE